MRYACHRTSEEGELPRILFYSVLLHYVVFYIMFGNPFLIQRPSEGTSPGARFFDVQLLSPPPQAPPGGPKPVPVNRNISLGGSQVNLTEAEISRLFEVPEGFRDGKALPVASKPPSVVDQSLDDGISVVDRVNTPPEAEQISVLKSTTKDLPANVTGPDDCLLKVVGMVCPNGDAACIAAYKEFCASLAK
ncbi:MAG: hypothetical protein ABGX83_11085 [Nitrospira sp.]